MRTCFILLATCCLAAPSAFGQGGDFFWTLGDDPVINSDVSNTSFSVGDSGSLFLYYTTNGPSMSELDTGGGVDFFTSDSNVIEFTAAEAFDFDVALASNPDVVLGTRWGDFFGPGDILADGQEAEIAAFNV